MNALDFINEASPIPYVKGFLSRREADALFAFIQQNFAATPERNKQNSNSFYRILKYATYVTDPDNRTKQVYGPKVDIKDAPEEIKTLLRKISRHTGKDINYASILGYRDEKDHILFHNHSEDFIEEDQSVYVISLGHNRELVLRPTDAEGNGIKDRNLYETILPEHGSLYTLPSEYNVTHQHEIPDSKFRCGLRISINCKHEKAPDPKPQFIRKPGPPRIYDQHAGNIYPSNAAQVDRTTIFGNHSRHDTATQGGRDAWHAEVAEKMKDARFSWEVGKLRGKNLLCWCSPQQVKDGHCHALAWLKLASGMCLSPGCKKPAIGARPDYGIGSNGFCLELHGGANTGDDTHPAQMARGIPKLTPEELIAQEKRIAQIRLKQQKENLEHDRNGAGR